MQLKNHYKADIIYNEINLNITWFIDPEFWLADIYAYVISKNWDFSFFF